MSVNAGKGQGYHTLQTPYLVANITKDSASTVSLGWVPGGTFVIGAGVMIETAWNGTGDEAVDIGFRNSVEGHTDDADAFTETILDLDAAVGHLAGDVVSANNLYFSEPAEIFATITNTDATAGNAYVYVTYLQTDLS